MLATLSTEDWAGPYAASNPFRFATKYTDIETGLVQYNLRYYSPSLGRFINRDPIEESGGLNLYAYVRNQVANRWDNLGLTEGRPPGISDEQWAEWLHYIDAIQYSVDPNSNTDGSLNGFFSGDFVESMTGNDRSFSFWETHTAELNLRGTPTGMTLDDLSPGGRLSAEGHDGPGLIDLFRPRTGNRTSPLGASGNAGNIDPDAPTRGTLAEGTYAFEKDLTYLHVYSGREQGSGKVAYDKGIAESLAVMGTRLLDVDVDRRPAILSYSTFFAATLRGTQASAVIWGQHGELTGVVDKTLSREFGSKIAPALAPYLMCGGDVVLSQCYGVFEDGYLKSVSENFGGTPITYARGYNAYTTLGIVSYMPNFENGRLITNQYTPWLKYPPKD